MTRLTEVLAGARLAGATPSDFELEDARWGLAAEVPAGQLTLEDFRRAWEGDRDGDTSVPLREVRFA